MGKFKYEEGQIKIKQIMEQEKSKEEYSDKKTKAK